MCPCEEEAGGKMKKKKTKGLIGRIAQTCVKREGKKKRGVQMAVVRSVSSLNKKKEREKKGLFYHCIFCHTPLLVLYWFDFIHPYAWMLLTGGLVFPLPNARINLSVHCLYNSARCEREGGGKEGRDGNPSNSAG